ncbi:DUF4493 domain-containing protein [Parabacteroides sp.]
MFGRKWRYYVGLLGLLLGLNACVTEDLRGPSEGQGYLRLELASVITELSSSPQTKATTVSIPNEDIPDVSGFMIDIQKGGTSIDGFPKKFSELSASTLVLPIGDYTVSASYGENVLIQKSPYFYGSSNVTVLPNQQVTAFIEATLANALLVPAVDESLRKHYSTWALTLKVGGESMPLASKENSNNHLYVKAGQSVTGVFNGKNLAEKETSTEWTVIPETASCTQYTIQCNPDLSVFSNIQLTAKATHTYNNGFLTGTDVVLNLAANGAPVEAIASWDIKVLYNGETIRSYSNNPDNATMDVSEGWPYVPQGSTLSASILLKAGDKIDLSSTTMETIPMPTFTATVSGNTSYSVYKSSGAAVANEKDGSSIFDIATTVNISSDILNNANYSNLLKVTYTTDGGGNSGELPYGTVGTLTGLTWQKHALTAAVSFDGETVASSPVECHVTGLPYKGDFSSIGPAFGADVKSWITVGSGGEYWSGRGYILFQYYFKVSKNCYVFSPAFQLPENVNVTYSTKVAYFTWGAGDATIEVYTGISGKTGAKVKDKTSSIKRINSDTSPEDSKFTTISAETSIGNNYRVCISHDEGKDGNAAEDWLTFKTLDVLYR